MRRISPFAFRGANCHLAFGTHYNTYMAEDVFGRGGRAKAGPLGVPFAANPRRGKGVNKSSQVKKK